MILAYVWTGIAAIGMGFAAVNAWDARLDMRAVELSAVNGARRILAHASVRAEGLRFIALFLFFAVGVNALWFPTWAGSLYLFQYGLTGGAACIALNSVLGRRTRTALREALEHTALTGVV